MRERPRGAPRRAAERGNDPLDRARAASARRSRPRRRHRARTSTSSFRCSTGRTARTARSRACSSSPTSRTSARACSRRRVGMDKALMKVAVRRARPAGLSLSRRPAARLGAPARHDRRRARDGAAVPDVREAGQPGIERRHLEGEGPGRPARGDGPRRTLRPQDRRRGRRAQRPRDRVRGARQRRAARRRCPARSSRRASSTTTRRSTSTRGRRRSSRRTCRQRSPTRSGGCRSRRSRRSTAPAWRASTSCSRATPAAIFLNEVNTIPGFTTISMYSKLWAASGVELPGAARPPRSRSRSSATPRSSSCAPAST